MWDIEISIQVKNPATAVMFNNQLNTTLAPLDDSKYARKPSTEVVRTAAYGMPDLVVHVKYFGARPFIAMLYAIRDPT